MQMSLAKEWKRADGMANSVNPDHTAPKGAVWYGSTMFYQDSDRGFYDKYGMYRYNSFGSIT